MSWQYPLLIPVKLASLHGVITPGKADIKFIGAFGLRPLGFGFVRQPKDVENMLGIHFNFEWNIKKYLRKRLNS